MSRDEAVEPGDLVAFDAGVIVGGYSGELGRTHVVDGDVAIDRALSRSWDELWDRLLAACRPGAPLTELLDAYAPRAYRRRPCRSLEDWGSGSTFHW